MCRSNAAGDSPFQGLAAGHGRAQSGLLEWTEHVFEPSHPARGTYRVKRSRHDNFWKWIFIPWNFFSQRGG